MTRKFKFTLITLLLAVISCLGISTVLSKYITSQPIGNGYFNLNILFNPQAHAVYSADDNSLEFFYGKVPEVGDTTSANKTVTAVYRDIDTTQYSCYISSITNAPSTSSVVPGWYTDGYAQSIESVRFDSTFSNVKPISTSGWFNGFKNATSFELQYLNTSNVTNMGAMFYACYMAQELDVSNFNTANVTNMRQMFAGCKKITALNVDNFNTSKVTRMDNMFSACEKLLNLDVSNFNTQAVEDMSYMFMGDSALQSINMMSGSNEKLKNIRYMFSACYVLTEINLAGFNTAKVTDMRSVFQGCHKLTTIYVTDDFNLSKVDLSGDMFKDCNDIRGGNGTTYNGNKVNKDYARIDGLNGYPGYFTCAHNFVGGTCSICGKANVA